MSVELWTWSRSRIGFGRLDQSLRRAPFPSRHACTSALSRESLAANRPSWGEHTPSVKGWVAFSDLHVSPRTLPQALEVLKTVHTVARDGDLGVLFLVRAPYSSRIF